MKKLLGPVERLYPMPCVLVVGGTADAYSVGERIKDALADG